MRIGIMQAYFFPYIGYFQLINSTEKFIIYEHVGFRKGSWVTRNRILDKGENAPIYINLSVSKKSTREIVSKVELTHREERIQSIEDLIFYNYKKAPFFKDIFYPIKGLLHSKETNLHKYNAVITKGICDLLDIETEIQYQNPNCLHIEDGLEESARLAGNNTMTQRVIDLCKLHKADHYINPIGGTELYSKADFKASGLEISFIKSDSFSYPQFKDPFVPGLSIVDVLMHNGIDKTKSILNNYTLI